LNQNGTVADPPLTPRELTVPANGQTAIFCMRSCRLERRSGDRW
jgi:hypothetical protein